ncbi:MAG: 2-C-methyl-D-erythritol 2,4-cyclodiphosphate synthase [Kiritimatiellia bacterium]
MIRTGIGFDIHRLAEGRKLVLGGVTIPHPVGLEGHSDADAVCHALMDALLGAVAAGDIGQHFPNTDPRWKNADSLEMLAIVAGLVRARGYEIANTDAMVMAEAPRLAPHIGLMRERLAAAMGIQPDQVSVKAGTHEKLGAIGRGEGIGALATAALYRLENRRM